MSGRLEEGIRATLAADPVQADRFFGNEAPIIDRPRAQLLSWFWDLRRAAPADQGLQWTLHDLRTTDPLLLHHLRAMDDEYLEDRRRMYEDKQAARALTKSQPAR